jgi:hypothetical protein
MMDKDDIQNYVDASDWKDVETEYGQEYSGGSLLLLEDHPSYPLERRIEHAKKFGGRIYKRLVLVISDWEEVDD